jgi:phospholipid/cholesterol/gamma-HCH transport system substrate-binding protein
MMQRNLFAGLFVLAALTLFAAGLFLVGNRNKAFDHHMEFYADYANLNGLAKGAKVRVSGMEAGQVVDIQIPSSPSSQFRVKMQIDAKLHGLVRTDSVTTIGTEGIVGDTYLLIHTGSPQASAASNLSTLPTKEPFDFDALLEKGNGVISDADKTINDTDKTITQLGSKLQTTLGKTDTTISNVNDVVAGIKQGRGAVGLLLRNQGFAGEVQQTVDNAQKATGSLAHASGQADQMISSLQARNLPQKLDDTLNSARNAAAQLDATSKQLNHTLAEATAPDSQGNTAGANLRDSLSNANAATANLSEDTEALKHEFFFKGFFKKRGYYTLNNIDPARYRTDKVFTSSLNQRFWLSAAALFQTGSDGTEELSAGGKEALDDAVARDGGPAILRPIVVEGYSNNADAATQVAVSRRRSILVSQYLQKHFSLDPQNVGFVALAGMPTADAGHAGFDGVCINVLPPKK